MSEEAPNIETGADASDLPPMQQPYAYLCYSSRDFAFVEQLRKSLEEAGIRYFQNWDLKPGTQAWEKALLRGIEHATWVVFVVTPQSVTSEFARAELAYANYYSRGGQPRKMIIAIMRESVLPVDLPLELIMSEFIDFRQEDRYADAMAKLLRRLSPDREMTQEEHREAQESMVQPDVKSDLPAPERVQRLYQQARDALKQGELQTGLADLAAVMADSSAPAVFVEQLQPIYNAIRDSAQSLVEMRNRIETSQKHLLASGMVDQAAEEFARSMEATMIPALNRLLETLLSTLESLAIPPLDAVPGSGGSVTFTLTNPGRVHRQKRYTLLVHAHKPEQKSAIQQDAHKFADELGESPKERHSGDPIPIAPKTEITIVPEAEGITFDPPELTKTWDEKWLRFNFDFEVPEEYPDEEIWLRVSVQVKGFEVACIKSSCEIVAETVAAAAPALPDDPLVDPLPESGMRTADAHLYRNVFLSYSHKDEEIAWRRARQIEQALGDRVFMDVKDLRAGEDWETRLFEWIDQADIIHLLWSENSAKSDYCRKEWTYALEKKCGDTRCFGVIRPVYWQKPMPEPPPELAHLHFQPIKLEEE